MKAMVLEKLGQQLQENEVAVPEPASNEVLVKVDACGVCRTDLHVVDGELELKVLPIIPGHEIVGRVVKVGSQVKNLKTDQRIGIPWLGNTCGQCQYCLSNKENLCDNAIFTGYLRNGGYAPYTVADANYCFPIPESYNAAEAAPLLCAGLIGWRSLKLAGDGKKLGLYGFGASAHIIIQIAKSQGREIFAFTRPADKAGQDFALSLGAKWAGSSEQVPPEKLDAAIIFAPIGSLIPSALKATVKGGVVVCAGIHMSDIPSFPYDLLWGERIIRSVANLTREDGIEFFEIIKKIHIKTTVKTYPLKDANYALSDLKTGKITGAAVLIPDDAS